MTDTSQESQFVLSGLREAVAALQHLHSDMEAQSAHTRRRRRRRRPLLRSQMIDAGVKSPPKIQTPPDGGEVAPTQFGDHLVSLVEDVAHLDGMVAT